ncbi:hypothetical protein HNY73_004035 [Argiope bruennichi]|uniref:Uncharacterized protein n=1 Tax=Argiope bruennichi TaxID=94029 RepID=A0A8T0FUL2_ARGBR|nr:hypothetical protein HNY73_004035 [Argiope bruennichi]
MHLGGGPSEISHVALMLILLHNQKRDHIPSKELGGTPKGANSLNSLIHSLTENCHQHLGPVVIPWDHFSFQSLVEDLAGHCRLGIVFFEEEEPLVESLSE